MMKDAKILYELKMHANYKDDLDRYIFVDMEKAQHFMREKWQEAINTDYFDYKRDNYSVRESANIVRDETYFEDNYAVVTWREDGFHQWVQFNIEEVFDMLSYDVNMADANADMPHGYTYCYKALQKAMLKKPIQYEAFTVYFDIAKLESVRDKYGVDLYQQCLADVRKNHNIY